MAFDIRTVIQDAETKFKRQEHEKAVEKHLEAIRKRKAHLLPKRVKFQWPIKLEPWFNPKGL